MQIHNKFSEKLIFNHLTIFFLLYSSQQIGLLLFQLIDSLSVSIIVNITSENVQDV